MPEDHKPIVGISGSSASSKSVLAMMERVRESGGIPMLLSDHAKRSAVEDLEKVDSLIFMGNNQDIDPAAYGQEAHPKGYAKEQSRAYEADNVLNAKIQAENMKSGLVPKPQSGKPVGSPQIQVVPTMQQAPAVITP